MFEKKAIIIGDDDDDTRLLTEEPKESKTTNLFFFDLPSDFVHEEKQKKPTHKFSTFELPL